MVHTGTSTQHEGIVGNVLIAQGGGPTVVINQSLVEPFSRPESIQV